MVTLAHQMGPGVEEVHIVAEGSAGAVAAFVVPQLGPGTTMVFPTQGQHLIGTLRGGAPGPSTHAFPPPNQDLLADGDKVALGMLSNRWQDAAAGGGKDVEAVHGVVQLAAQAALRDWPETVWLEEVLQMGCVAATTLVNEHGRAADALPALQIFTQQLVARDWLFGGPTGALDAQTAQAAMGALPMAQRAAQPPVPPRESQDRSADQSAKRRRWGRSR